MILSRACCNACGGPLTVHQEARDGVCDGVSCRRTVVQREIARRLEVIEASRRERADRVRDDLAAERGVPRASLPVYIVPAFRAPVAPLPASRRKKFIRHLRGLVRAVFAERERMARPTAGQRAAAQSDAPPVSDGMTRASAGERESTGHATVSTGDTPHQGMAAVTELERAACATCRGFCCRLGQDHAFLDVASVRAVVERFPDRTEREIRRVWMQALPEHAYFDGCVFQGAAGCVLDRGIRSWVCNEFQCRDLRALLADKPAGCAPQALLVAVDEEGVARHTTVGIA